MPGSAQHPRRILLVAYYYPPLNSIGARRPHALATWLRRRGHEVTVLTSVQSGRDPGDGAAGVERTPDLLATRINWRRGRSLQTVTGANDDAWSPGPGFWGSIVVPDIQLVSWIPFALRTARRLHRLRPFDAVVSTSPLESAHAVGLALHRRGVPWIADLRDGWRYQAPRGDWPLALQRRLDDALERRVVQRANAVVMVSERQSAELRRRHGIEVETITNGFDPELTVAAEDAPVDPAKLTLVYTGALGPHRTLLPVLDALARADPSVSERVELVLAGPLSERERTLYAEPRYARFVRHVGFLAHAEARALQAAADLLVLPTSAAFDAEIPGKLYEYLAAGRPILVLGTDNAAADIVLSAGAGEAIPLTDAGAAAAILRRALAGELPAPPTSAREPYAYPRLVERFERVIEQAIGRRSGVR